MLKDMVGDSNPMVVANAVTALTDIHQTALERDPTASPPCFVIDPGRPHQAAHRAQRVHRVGSHRHPQLPSPATAPATRSRRNTSASASCPSSNTPTEASCSAPSRSSSSTWPSALQRRAHQAARPQDGATPRHAHLVRTRGAVGRTAQHQPRPPKRPDILQNELRVFFCKYNDPSYVKLEKVEIMIKLANERNVDMLLSELKEYASEVDVDFVRRAIRAIGQCAIKIDAAAERCVHVLLDLIATKVSYVFRRRLSSSRTSSANTRTTTRASSPRSAPTSRSSTSRGQGIAHLDPGEYADKISNAEELLAHFLDSFTDEPYQVQFQRSPPSSRPSSRSQTAAWRSRSCSRCSRRRPRSATRPTCATVHSSTGGCSRRPTRPLGATSCWPTSAHLDPAHDGAPSVLDELVAELSSLASAYHKPAATFIGKVRFGADGVAQSGRRGGRGRDHARKGAGHRRAGPEVRKPARLWRRRCGCCARCGVGEQWRRRAGRAGRAGWSDDGCIDLVAHGAGRRRASKSTTSCGRWAE